MITNTNRLLYNGEYIPAYTQESLKKIRYKGSNYNITFEETSTSKVYKVELANCLTTYLSDCNIEVTNNEFKPISRLQIGDTVLTYLDNQLLTSSRFNARKLVLAFTGDKEAETEIKELYKIPALSDYKLLRNHTQFLASFITELIRENKVSMIEEEQYLRGFFTYELLQELNLVFSMFGIRSYLRKHSSDYWVIYFNVQDFLANILKSEPKYKVIPQKINNIQEIVQSTQAFKVSCTRLVVNSIMMQGDV